MPVSFSKADLSSSIVNCIFAGNGYRDLSSVLGVNRIIYDEETSKPDGYVFHLGYIIEQLCSDARYLVCTCRQSYLCFHTMS